MEKQIDPNMIEIIKKLSKLQSDMNYIKEQLDDTTLDGDDIKAIGEYQKEKKAGKLISSEDLKRELGL